MDVLELLGHGTANVEELADPVQLRGAAERFLALLDAFDGYSVVPASPQAERVLGAAMMLRPDLTTGVDGMTVIFDVNLASGTMLARAAQRVRDAGNNSRLVGIALHCLSEGHMNWTPAELSEVVVADCQATSTCGQGAQSGDRGLVLAG